MSLKRAGELGVKVHDLGLEFEFVEQWTKGDTRIEIRNVKTAEPVSAQGEHYIRKVNTRNGQVIWVSEVYSTRANARAAAAREFESREEKQTEVENTEE